jgi:hypothetical protein
MVPFDSVMMDIIPQQCWAKLANVTTLTLTVVSDLTLLKDDGTYWAKPSAHHLSKLTSIFGSVGICHQILTNTRI